MSELTIIDSFAGAGGGVLGVARALNGGGTVRVLGEFEICPDANFIREKNFGDGIPNHGDIGKFRSWKKLGKGHDLSIAGSPCTNLSIIRNAGSKNGDQREHLKGNESKLFYNWLRQLDRTQPKHFLLENVASMSNAARDEISRLLGVEPIRINSSLVSAQNRDRYYWTSWECTQPPDLEISLADIKLRCPFKYSYAWSKSFRPETKTHLSYMDERLRSDTKANCLTGSINGSESVNFFSKKKINHKPQRVFDKKDLLINTLKPGEWRKLFPIEAERLQTFPDLWTHGVSNTAAYRLMGKAMTVDVIAHLVRQMPGVK